MHWHIGTSGWHYQHWVGHFYPPDLASDAWLDYYAGHFDTVEINNSFYGLPTSTTIAHWLDATPDHFVFAAKASRLITHLKKLKQPEITLPPFLNVLHKLGARRGPALIQLPPRWHSNGERLAAFLEAWSAELACTFELRDADWQRPEIYALLQMRNAALCIYDLDGYTSPLLATADFTYLRLHGPGTAYRGRYSRAALKQWVAQVRRLDVEHVYVYFDNDEVAYAIRNGLELKELVA
jgi:uncharacterized protein YecE (DUF72 family)